MTKEQNKDTILEIIAQIIPDADVSNLRAISLYENKWNRTPLIS